MKILRNICIIFFILGFISCKNEIKNKKSEEVKVPINNSQTSLIGIWRLENEENPTFKIGKDSILYLDQYSKYKYKQNKNTLIIYFDDYCDTSTFHFTNNELIIKDSDGEESLYHKWTE